MQTFLPYADFEESAAALDRQRLGKQRLENITIMNALIGDGGYAHHPATLQWQGYEWGLYLYHAAICNEWHNVRGYKDAQFEKMTNMFLPWVQENDGASSFTHWLDHQPLWLGDEAYHVSHQSNLIRKNAEHYGPLFPGVPDDLEYVWPAKEERFSA